MTFSLVVLAFIFITGLVIGSFLNVVILRTVSEESIVFPASKCPKCQTPLKWYHNIPLFSYMFLRGKCAFCHEHISWQYPFVEFLTGCIFVGLFFRFCNPFDPLFGLEVMNPITWPQVILYIFSLIISCLFIALAGTDILEKKVSDAHTFSLIGVGIFYSILVSVMMFIYNYQQNGMPKINFDFFTSCPILYSVAAAILGFLIMEAMARLGLLFAGTRAFGEGDSYIAAGLGAVFGGLLGGTGHYPTFLPVFRALVAILVLSGIIQIIATLPIFIKKLITNKNWLTLSSITSFIIYTIGFLVAKQLDWLSHPVAYWSSIIVLIALALWACKELLGGIKENQENGLYLPFGPAMIMAGFIALITIVA